jgi:hypothetical protein
MVVLLAVGHGQWRWVLRSGLLALPCELLQHRDFGQFFAQLGP